MTESKRKSRVFICHDRSDDNAVDPLCTRLDTDGFEVWQEKVKLFGGEKWEPTIKKAVRESDYFLVCLSKQFNKVGIKQKKVIVAFENRPKRKVPIIPIRLEECNIPKRFQLLETIDLFSEDGYTKLIRSMNVGENETSDRTTKRSTNRSRKYKPEIVAAIIGGIFLIFGAMLTPLTEKMISLVPSPLVTIAGPISTSQTSTYIPTIPSPIKTPIRASLTPTQTRITGKLTSTITPHPVPSTMVATTNSHTPTTIPTTTQFPTLSSTPTFVPAHTPIPLFALNKIQKYADYISVLGLAISLLSFLALTISFGISLLIKPSNFDKFLSFFDNHPVILYLLTRTGALMLMKVRMNLIFKKAIQREDDLIDELHKKLDQYWRKLRDAIKINDPSSYKIYAIEFEEIALQMEKLNATKTSLEGMLNNINLKIDKWRQQ